ncbi:MAG TPA: poly-gamma-glutamate hydrolase family protein [Steroidobacteraceae bacterium]|nr:poly-gamma-glutamate hydrolase family protein [Steroidobacteraceae bacterium]
MNKYGSYAELARCESQGSDYRVTAFARPQSPVLIVAPHGGLIEVGTSEIAAAVAAEDHNLFSFEGLKPYGANRDLHITSHQFDHPDCLEMAARCAIVLSVHGCLGDSEIHVGGLDTQFAAHLAKRLSGAGFAINAASQKYPGRHPLNICNRGLRQQGAQLEITYDLRNGGLRAELARTIREAIASHAAGAA